MPAPRNGMASHKMARSRSKKLDDSQLDLFIALPSDLPARDQQDLMERMKAGEFTSVREAAHEAGIIKDVSLVTQIVRLWEKATPEERQAIRQRLALDAD